MEKILLVNAQETVSAFMVRALTKNGFDVIHTENVSGIALRVKFGSVDLIIIDADGSDESGFDVCRRLKQLEEIRYIPVLIISDAETGASMTRALAAGADDFMPRSFDEMTLVSKAKALLRIKGLSDELKKQYAAVEENNKLLEEQLNMAMHVQRSLIHEYDINHNGVRIMSRYLPALQIGGDFYDIIRLDEENISVVVGDVSGHGISAALLTAMLNMMIRTLAPKYYNPAQFLYYMNEEFNRVFENSGNNQMYACVFYAVINTRTKCVSYSNAGQSFPVLVNKDAEIAYELETGGNPIGLTDAPSYEHKITLYDEGDMILFFTDGLIDNIYKGKDDEFYEKTRKMLLEMSVNSDPSYILNAVSDAFCVSDATPNMKYGLDDVSMVLCKM